MYIYVYIKKKKTHKFSAKPLYKNFFEVKLSDRRKTILKIFVYTYYIKYINIFVRVVKCKIHFVLKLGLIYQN